MTIYKSRLSTALKYFAAVNLLVLASLAILKHDGLSIWLLLIVDIFYLASISFKEIPTKIVIDIEDGTLQIKSSFFFIPKKEKSFSLNTLKCTYQHEVSARGSSIRVLRITSSEGMVVELIPNIFGWDDDTLTMIFKGLQTYQVSKTP